MIAGLAGVDTLAPAALWRFPSTDPVEDVARTADPTDLIGELRPRLRTIVGLPITLSRGAADATAQPSSWFMRGDGLCIGFTVPSDFIGAVVGGRCGGPFVPLPTEGAGGAAIKAEVAAAVLAAADAAWPGAGGWQAMPPNAALPMFTLNLAAEGVVFCLPWAIGLPPAAAEVPPDTRAWHQSLAAALSATPFAVRAVLHDRIVPLRDALAMRTGDVLPIETRRDVSLRVGDRVFARGMITPDDEGGHRVTIVAAGLDNITPANKEQP